MSPLLQGDGNRRQEDTGGGRVTMRCQLSAGPHAEGGGGGDTKKQNTSTATRRLVTAMTACPNSQRGVKGGGRHNDADGRSSRQYGGVSATRLTNVYDGMERAVREYRANDKPDNSTADDVGDVVGGGSFSYSYNYSGGGGGFTCCSRRRRWPSRRTSCSWRG